MLFLNNDDIHQLLHMQDCINIQEAAFKGLAEGHSVHRPRIDMYVPCEIEDGYWRWGTMEGATQVPGPYFAIRKKSDVIQWTQDQRSGLPREDKYCVEPGTYCGLIMLFSTRNGEPLAIMNDGHLQHMRVGGDAGLGVKYLSREDASTVGMLGQGGMARTYLEAFCAVRDIKQVKVYSPNRENRELYAREMEQQLQLEVTPVDSAREAVSGVDMISTFTSSMVPKVEHDWLEPGMHVTNLGPFELSEEFYIKPMWSFVKVSQEARQRQVKINCVSVLVWVTALWLTSLVHMNRCNDYQKHALETHCFDAISRTSPILRAVNALDAHQKRTLPCILMEAIRACSLPVLAG